MLKVKNKITIEYDDEEVARLCQYTSYNFLGIPIYRYVLEDYRPAVVLSFLQEEEENSESSFKKIKGFTG